ncbi:hypothetical protein T4D_12755 [Trichinella pseudospiralis]|uniref:Uncharacterized protein n=1 Tax=Trichinella pseudospiralis TaxID=6337 RepID=A0A0V1FLG2_TRIPS|nr:hypothetical protein T4D_12755 [Trichinella pseudospiralis]
MFKKANNRELTELNIHIINNLNKKFTYTFENILTNKQKYKKSTQKLALSISMKEMTIKEFDCLEFLPLVFC